MNLQEHFPHYFPSPANDLKQFFDKAIFVFDTNVYLDLYRLGPVARSEVLNALRLSLANRIWIPHHVALEVSKNRTALVLESSDNLEQHLQNIQSGLRQAKQVLEDAKLAQSIDHALLQAAANSIEATFQKVVEEVTKKIEACATPSSDDEILRYINENLESRPMQAPSQEWYARSAKDAVERYSRKHPPGYKDDRKDEVILGLGNVQIAQKYGDYYIWKQLLEAVKTNPADFENIVFVTSDRKEDWWEITRGKALGPRPELKLEITDAGAKTFHMYQLQRLVELLKNQVSSNARQPTISDETLAEIREVEVQPTELNELGSQLGFGQNLGFGPMSHRQPLTSFHSKSREEVHEYLSQAAVRRWLEFSFENAIITENMGFPDLVAIESRDNTAVTRGFEIVSPGGPDHLHATIVGTLWRANAWLGLTAGLLSDFEIRSLVFVVALKRHHLTGILSQSFWQNTVDSLRNELAGKTDAQIMVGVIEDGVFQPLSI